MAYRKRVGMLGAVALAAAGLGLSASAVWATEGYVQNGDGARQKALAGAGVADSTDATSISLNPAGLVNAPDNELDTSMSFFAPYRYVEGAAGAGVVPDGRVDSKDNLFFIPNMAWSKKVNLPFADVVGFSVYGGGGNETKFPAVTPAGSYCQNSNPSGVFCTGTAGGSLQQMLISLAVAKTIAPGVSVGIAPILARQTLEIKGMGAFAYDSNHNAASIDTAHVSDQGTDVVWGGGARAGIEAQVAPHVRLGIAASTRIWSQKFDNYRGLLAGQGEADIPPILQAGVAVDVSRDLTLMADYRRIWFSTVSAIGNPATNQALLGSDNGPGFGYADVNALQLGAEYRAAPGLTLRGGYAYNNNPISSPNVMFDIIGPATVQQHLTAGAEMKVMKGMDFEIAGMYAPWNKVSGTELSSTHGVTVGLEEFEVTAGIKYQLGQ